MPVTQSSKCLRWKYCVLIGWRLDFFDDRKLQPYCCRADWLPGKTGLKLWGLDLINLAISDMFISAPFNRLSGTSISCNVCPGSPGRITVLIVSPLGSFMDWGLKAVMKFPFWSTITWIFVSTTTDTPLWKIITVDGNICAYSANIMYIYNIIDLTAARRQDRPQRHLQGNQQGKRRDTGQDRRHWARTKE